MKSANIFGKKWFGAEAVPDPRFLELVREIQHDATEGLVPVEDVLPLVDAVMDGRSGIKQLQELRAKHPNLFTK